MRWILFLARVTLLCNLCFALMLIIRYTGDFIKNQNINNYIIILAYSAVFINFFVNIMQIIMLLRRKEIPVSSWLAITNFLFLLVQIFFYS